MKKEKEIQSYAIEDHMLFYPKTERDLKSQYPELSTYPEFKKLVARELLFVWWYANPSSPFALSTHINKVNASLSQVYGRESVPEEKRSKWSAGDFSQEMRTAIERMESFDVPARIKAKNMVYKMLKNFEKIIDVDVDDSQFQTKEGEQDWSKKKAYIDSCTNVSDALPKLLKQLEQGFGITDKEDEKATGSGIKAIDKFHQS